VWIACRDWEKGKSRREKGKVESISSAMGHPEKEPTKCHDRKGSHQLFMWIIHFNLRTERDEQQHGGQFEMVGGGKRDN